MNKFVAGMVVRQKATESRYDYATITYVHSLGGLDVIGLINGVKYGWSSSVCEFAFYDIIN